MYNIVSLVFKYIFIFIIYTFILSIMRLIYLDIKSIDLSEDSEVYLKLMNMQSNLPFKVKEYYPVDKVVTIGRKKENNISIRDPFMSKEHSKIFLQNGRYYLKDLNSANGTYVNGDKIQDILKIENGDIVRMGQVEFIFVEKE